MDTVRTLPISVLVVDDDPSTRYMIIDYLETHDIRAVSAASGSDMKRRLAGGEPDLVILSLRVGQEDGLDLLRDLRSRSDSPMIITTSHEGDEIDGVVGLELGADDHMTKPLGLHELLARIRAILRRRGAERRTSQYDQQGGRLRFGGWQLDPRLRRLTDPNGAPVTLTRGDYSLLLAFLDAPQCPLSRERLLQATRMDENISDRAIDVQVLRLRRKLQADPTASHVIQTERGFGYVFTLPVERL